MAYRARIFGDNSLYKILSDHWQNFVGDFLASRGRVEAPSKGAWDVKHVSGGLYDISFILASVNLQSNPRERRAVAWDDSIEALRWRQCLAYRKRSTFSEVFSHSLISRSTPPRGTGDQVFGPHGHQFTGTLELFRKRTRDIFMCFIEPVLDRDV